MGKTLDSSGGSRAESTAMKSGLKQVETTPALKRWKLIIAYDGTGFAGWQRQKNGLAVQELIETAAGKLFGIPVTVHGASRTDSGVHAIGQCAHFDQPLDSRTFPSKELLLGLNAHLPPQIRVLRASRVRPDFHSRFQALGKRYEYRILNSRVLPPHDYQRAWQVSLPLDVQKMREAAAVLVGTHDFLAFSAFSKDRRENTVRTIHDIRIVGRGEKISVIVEGDGFLYRMVRSIAGSLVRVGLGRESVEWVGERLRGRDRLPGVVTAPPDGLYLIRVFYPVARGADCSPR